MAAKHKKSQYFFNDGLFTGLTSFEDLENRIANLPLEQKGDAFEVFAEAYFNTQSKQQALEVWPEKQLPQSLRDKLGIPVDAGVDGVFLTHAGLYKAYQIKFRTGRTALTWDGDGLGKFFGQTDRVSERVLFTNSIDLSHITNNRVDFYSIKGNDLDVLEQADFKAIEIWLRSGSVIREKKSPRPHQLEAIENIVKELNTNDRTTAIMACGTGKTLVALWVAEKMGAQTIIVLLPSLALVKQTLHEWAGENNWKNFNYLCVCSDSTVVQNEDEIILSKYDLDFSVTTRKEVIQEFLNNQTFPHKIIFSTYQSCPIVAKAISQGFSFDLAIFDEAHKTASRQATNYAFALQDKYLSIKKRLFITATPRHYNVNKKDKEGDQKIVFSMDDPKIYGWVAYKLSFREAVKRDLICDYKVLISIVTSEMINRELLKRGEVIIEGDVIKAQRIANILAIQNAIENYGIKRIFSFHSSVSAAKSFTAKTNEGVALYLKNFTTLHVNGDMPTSRRDLLLKEFKESEKAIISNARCLTEGVNLPAVDMVAFISPKRSKVDIVQAAGRAMRKHDGKKCGYIFIPLFVQLTEGEILEQAIKKTQFDTVWDVLQAIQEQDESLIEIIELMRENLGKGLGVNDNGLREYIEILGPELLLNELRRSIITQIIDKLGVNWDERFGELLRFKELFGDCNVPQDYSENSDLGVWVSIQRCAYKARKISYQRIKKLESIGFEWNQHLEQWKRMFAVLCEYYEKNGNCLVPTEYSENKELGMWVVDQRKNRRRLSQERIVKLESIGFEFYPLDRVWDARFAELCQYRKKYGDNPPTKSSEYHNLAIWMQHQRIYYREGRLPVERIARLESIGFDWDPLTNLLEVMFSELCKYREIHGDCNVPAQYAENPALGIWISNQRTYYKEKKLSKDRIDRLEAIGFLWNPLIEQWEKMFAALCTYYKEQGHCNVPKRYSENPKLGKWCQKQRNDYKEGKIVQNRINRLEAIEFLWSPRAAQWERMFAMLCEYHKKQGHCNVPHKFKKNLALGLWVSVQRRAYKTNKLLKDYINRLELIGFDWDPLATYWEMMFAELCRYREVHGDCIVPAKYFENKELGRWVSALRTAYNNKGIYPERLKRLNDIGFIWRLVNRCKSISWEDRFSQLCNFKEFHGHCDVPRNYPENQQLERWVRTQRENYKRGCLLQKKIDLLTNIGLVWGFSNKNNDCTA